MLYCTSQCKQIYQFRYQIGYLVPNMPILLSLVKFIQITLHSAHSYHESLILHSSNWCLIFSHHVERKNRDMIDFFFITDTGKCFVPCNKILKFLKT